MEKVKKNKKSTIFIILLSIVLLLDWQLGNTARMLLLSLSVFLFIPIRKYFDKQFYVLLFFTFFYVVTAFFNGFQTSLVGLTYSALPGLALFLLGSYIGDHLQEDKIELAILVVLAASTGYIIFLSLSDFISSGQIINIGRAIYTDADHEVVLVGDRSALSVGAIGLPLALFFKSKYRLPFLIISLLSLFSSIHYLHRTPLVVCMICFLVTLMYVFRRRNTFVVILTVLLCIVAAYYLGFFDSNDVTSAYSERNAEDAGTLGSRLPRWLNAIGNVFIYPFGWYNEKNINTYYVHNMWLDVARTVGLLPFVFLTIFTIRCSLISLKNKKLMILFLLLDIGYLFSCFVEPVFEAYPTHAWLYMFYSGMKLYYSKQKALAT